MINWNESAKLNNCTIDELKARFVRFPKSGKKIIRICNECGGEREITFEGYRDLCFKCSRNTPECRKALSDAGIKQRGKEKSPLPSGQSITIPKNKNCTSYLGCLAEELLALTFKDVRRMPINNPGYDLICNQNFKIDVKASALGHLGHWNFSINKNTIADYFLCIAFESRNDITPTHVWLIPGEDVNHKVTINISKSTIVKWAKWAKYEQPLERVLACCDVMKEEK